MLKRLISALAVPMLLMGGSTVAKAQSTAQCGPTTYTVAEKINRFVSPVTDAVSDFIFYPIPLKGGSDIARGAIRVSDTRLVEGDVLSVSINGTSIIYEMDRDGVVCPSHTPVQMGVDGTETAATLDAHMQRDFGATAFRPAAKTM